VAADLFNPVQVVLVEMAVAVKVEILTHLKQVVVAQQIQAAVVAQDIRQPAAMVAQG
jgi:hypothetical protein